MASAGEHGMNVKRSLESRIRGWFPQEPLSKNLKAYNVTTPETNAALNKKAFKTARIANAISVGIFLGTNFLVLRPVYHYYLNLEMSILAFSFFIVALITVNVVIYRHYRQPLFPKRGR
jgi:hypothetical protein